MSDDKAATFDRAGYMTWSALSLSLSGDVAGLQAMLASLTPDEATALLYRLLALHGRWLLSMFDEGAADVAAAQALRLAAQ